MVPRIWHLFPWSIALATLPAQQPLSWRTLGSPAGAPAGCSVQAAATAIDAFFVAMRAADSIGLARATAPVHHNHFEFSTGKFTPTDSFVVAHSVPELLKYARGRARQHEQISIEEVTFNEWRGSALEFGPMFFLRSANDLGARALPGVGKGEYWCRKGITILNTAPRCP
jgi:hypothetical protein